MKKNNFNNSKESTLLVIFIIACLALGGIYYFAFNDLLKTKKDIVFAREEAMRSKAESDQIEVFKKNIASTLDSQNTLSKIYINEDEIINFITMVEDLGKESGVIVVTESIDAKESDELKDKNKEILSVSLNTSGSFSDSIKYLELIENLPYKIQIPVLNLSFVEAEVLPEVKTGETKGDAKEIKATKKSYWKGSIKFEAIKNVSLNKKKDTVDDKKIEKKDEE